MHHACTISQTDASMSSWAAAHGPRFVACGNGPRVIPASGGWYRKTLWAVRAGGGVYGCQGLPLVAFPHLP